MATRGRNICNTLKAIRKQIADTNDINYSPEECHFEGECKGTCPRCEQDVRDLEHELHLRQMAGKAIKVAGIAAGLVAMTACSDGKPQRNVPNTPASQPTALQEDSIDPTMINGEIDHTKPIKRVIVEKFTPPKENITKGAAPVIRKDKQDKGIVTQPAVATDSTESSKIFGAVEEMASFPGGSAACMQYIADNIRAPKECFEGIASGRVILGFTVNEDGSLSDIKVMRSLTPALDEEAIRVVRSMPKWNPAKQNGKAVKSKYTLPVTFRWQ